MKEIKGNIFDLAAEPEVDSICITTNGIVNANGLAIMGAGSAGEAARRWPTVRANLGKCLNTFGNQPFVIGILNKENNFRDPSRKDIMNKDYKCLVWSFPTKNDFRFKSDMNLIENSVKVMVKMADTLNLKKICLPRPGCTNGKLSYINDVRPLISNLLDDRFYITTLKGEK